MTKHELSLLCVLADYLSMPKRTDEDDQKVLQIIRGESSGAEFQRVAQDLFGPCRTKIAKGLMKWATENREVMKNWYRTCTCK